MALLTVLVDNEAREPLKPAWGLSILVELDGTRVLWDTGPSEDVLRANAKVLGKELNVDYLILSHRHWDHVGGIGAVTYREAVVPKDPLFPKLRESRVNEGGLEVTSRIKVTRPLAHFDLVEQGLVVFGDEKVALLVGCSHPGVTNIYASVVEDLGVRPEIVIGGFHLYGSTKREVERTIAKLRELGAKEIYPIHCSGHYAKQITKVNFKAGSSLRF